MTTYRHAFAAQTVSLRLFTERGQVVGHIIYRPAWSPHAFCGRNGAMTDAARSAAQSAFATGIPRAGPSRWLFVLSDPGV